MKKINKNKYTKKLIFVTYLKLEKQCLYNN